MFQAIRRFSFAPLYAIFAPADGFAEFVVVVSLTVTIVLAFTGKLTDSYAAALTAISGFGVVHDNCSAWLARRLEKFQKPPVIASGSSPAAQ